MKKFGKFLLFTAGVAAVCAGVYYFLQNKSKFTAGMNGDEDDDYDDFSEDLDDTDSNRSYVALNHDADKKEDQKEDDKKDENFTKLSSMVSDAADKATEKVEEFFDEDSSKNEENR